MQSVHKPNLIARIINLLTCIRNTTNYVNVLVN